MTRAVVTRSEIAGHHAVVLENRHLRAVMIPALGGRVWTLDDLARARQWIWHRPNVPLVSSAPGAVYDEVWAGGWEELFPNDAAGRFEGRDLPDHGEWWTLAFDAVEESDDRSARVRMTARSTFIKAECTKTFTLEHDESVLRVNYQVRSLEPVPFKFLFKQHLAVAVTPACRLTLPGGRVEPVDPSFGTILAGSEPCEWPGRSDLQVIPPASSRAREFIYVRDLPASWCGVDDRAHNASLRMEYDRDVMPFVWLFLSYGGWNDVYTAVLEPCTNMPKDLESAARLGQAAMLPPGGVFATSVSVRLSAMETSTSAAVPASSRE
jgi:hypothetical protein